MCLLSKENRKRRKADRKERREIRRTDRLSGTRLGQFLRNPAPYKHPRKNKNK